MENFFELSSVPVEHARGASSISGTQRLRSQLPDLFKKYNIKSMFDAGCQDCAWAHLLSELVEYQGGEIDPVLVSVAKANYPTINIVEFNILTDNFPLVDLLFARDITIHFSNIEKQLFLQNFKKSGIPWLLVTQLHEATVNTDIVSEYLIRTAITNWCLPPWNWPAPQDNVWEFAPGGRSMSLWHRDQIQDLI